MLFVAFNVGNYGVPAPPDTVGSAAQAHARGPVRVHTVSRPPILYPTQPSPVPEGTRFVQMEACPAPGFSSSRSGTLTASGSLDTNFSSPAPQRAPSLAQ